MKENAPHAMIFKGFKLRKDQTEYLAQFRKEGGNPSQLLRIALDKEIERRKAREQII